MKKDIDLTIGSPFKKILAFTLPLAIGFMLQNLYTLCDSFIVSLARGEDAVTGINVTSSFCFMVIGFAQGAAAGFGIVLSQFVGAKDIENMRKSFATSIFLSLIIGIILTIVMLLVSHNILLLLSTDKDFIEYSEKYVKAIFSGIIFTILYNLSDQILRAMGDSKTPLFILILSAILNVALNLILFITDLPPEWTGYTTVISQAVAAAVGFIIIFIKYRELRLKKSDFKFSADFIGKHLKSGLPMAFEFTITSIGCMIQQRAFNRLGNNDYTKAQSTGNKIDSFFNSLIFGSANGFSVFCGQNFGAKRLDRVKQGAKCGLWIGLICSSICYILAMTLCLPFAKLLLYGTNEDVYGYVFTYISTQSVFYFLLYILVMYRQCLQGLGKSNIAIFGGIVELIMRIFAAALLAKNFGFKGACFSNPLAWLGGAAFYIISLIIVIKNFEKKFAKKSKDFIY